MKLQVGGIREYNDSILKGLFSFFFKGGGGLIDRDNNSKLSIVQFHQNIGSI